MPQIIEHLEAVVGELDAPPILMGHSAGGVFTQILLDHGFGAAGVAINSAPTEGVKVVPLSQIRATFPVLQEPGQPPPRRSASRPSSGTTRSPTRSARRSRCALYERYHIPASGSIFWGSALANIHPGKDDNWVDYDNDDRAPLLFISGSDDHLMPPKIQQSNAKHYKSGTITEVKEFAGPAPAAVRARLGGGRRLRARLGARARDAAEARDRRPAHPHRRPDGADRGRRLAPADRPDVRPARPAVPLRLGDGVAQARRAGDRGRATSGRSTPSCSPTTTTTTTSTPPGRALLPRAGAVVTTASRAPGASAAARAAWRRGRRPRSTRPGGPRSRSPRRRAGTARRSATRSSAT